MPDITMCGDAKCPLKEDCYRFKAKPSEYMQSWFTESPRSGDKCEYQMKMVMKSPTFGKENIKALDRMGVTWDISEDYKWHFRVWRYKPKEHYSSPDFDTHSEAWRALYEYVTNKYLR
jgi:hypothetical protein